MNVLARTAAATAAAVFSCGCATLTRGTHEWLVVETVPAGATVKISSGSQCVSPCRVRLSRKSDHALDIRLEGYEPVSALVLADDSAAGAAGLAGNVLIGGLIGMGIDSATGATKSFFPNPVRVELQPAHTAESNSSASEPSPSN